MFGHTVMRFSEGIERFKILFGHAILSVLIKESQ